MKTLDELRKERDTAASAARHIADAKSSKRDALLRAYRATIDIQLAEEFNVRIDDAWKALEVAEKAFNEAKIESAKAGFGAKYPIGTRLVEWKSIGKWSSASRPSGKIGIVEVAGFDLEHPLTMADYSKAKPGDFIIRVLKADGTPSKIYRHIGDSSWRPEPKQEAKAS